MAIGLAFVDIVGDTSRTAEQVERDMTRVLAVVEEDLDPLDIQAAVQSGTEQNLVRDLNQDIRAAQAAINAVQVDARLDPDTQAELTRGLRAAIQQSRARIGEIEVRVDADRPVRDARRAFAEIAAQVQAANAAMPRIEIETVVDSDRLQRLLAGVGSAAAAAVKPVALLGVGLVALGSALPALASIVASLQAMLPAAALAAPAILAVVSAVAAVKLATNGVGDAVKAAFDTSDPEAYREALKKLSPEARQFVGELAKLQPALSKLQQGVQNRVFDGLAESFKSLATAVLPGVSAQLLATGDTLNKMAKGAIEAAKAVSATGVLGQALEGTRKGLNNLSTVPGTFVTALTTLAAGAAPQFDKLTASLAKGFAKVTDKLSASLTSGGLTKSIDLAIVQFKLLFEVIGNVGDIFSNITGAAGQVNSAFGVLAKVTGEIEKLTASDSAQRFFRALFESVDLLLDNALSLLGPILRGIGDAFVALQPGLTAIINALGPALGNIFKALGPVLVSIAKAVSGLAIAIAPILPLISDLIVALLPVLIPLFDGLAAIFLQMAPSIQTWTQIMGGILVPILSLLPGLIQPFITALVKITGELLPFFNNLLLQLQPSMQRVIDAFVELAKELQPVIADVVELSAELVTRFIPLLQPIIDLIADLAGVFSRGLAQGIREIVLPALRAFTAFLNGDMVSGVANTNKLLNGLSETIIEVFTKIPGILADIMGRAVFAMYGIGRDIIGSLINGITSKIPNLTSLLGGITQKIVNEKGPPELDRRLLTPAGQSIMDSLINGIASRVPELQTQLRGITSMIDGTSMGSMSVGVGGVPVPASASGFAAGSAPRGGGEAVPNVQVFIGQQQLTDIVDVRIASVNKVQARQVTNGFRR